MIGSTLIAGADPASPADATNAAARRTPPVVAVPPEGPAAVAARVTSAVDTETCHEQAGQDLDG